MRFFVDNVLQLDKWQDQAPSSFTVTVNLTAGVHDLRVEYYEHGGGAVAQIYWERGNGNVTPTLSKYQWTPTPIADQPFGGTIIGTGFAIAGTEVWFCPVNSNNCSQHPAVGVTVNEPRNLSVVNVRLSAGSWQVYVKTAAGPSEKSAPFTVQAAPASCIGTVAPDRWRGEYFNNRTLTGNAAMVRDDSDVNGGAFFAHNWDTGSPNASCGVAVDDFSVRWTRRQNFEAGQYKFTLRADDGVRFYVDNVVRLDKWQDQAPTEFTVAVDLTAGNHDLKVEYYEHAGGAVAQIYWERTAGNSAPTISRYEWNSTPVNNQPFGGRIFGGNFATGSTEVWFCPVNSNNCSQHPPAGVTVNDPATLSLVNVRLSTGSWQVFLKTAAGTSDKSTPFTVQAAPASCIATVAPDHWQGEYFNNRTLTGNAVMVRDDSDVNGGTFFAHNWGTGSPNAACGVAVDDFSVRWTRRQSLQAGQYKFTLRADDGVRFYVDNVVRLDKWQDQAPTEFTVAVDLTAGNHDLKVEYYEHAGGAVAQIYWERTAGNSAPTISRYEWNSTPIGDQPFAGKIFGGNFATGSTEVWFCPVNSNNCSQHPPAGVTVNDPATLSVVNVRLSTGSWQVLLKTAAGVSDRSTPFAVQSGAPTIRDYSWSPTPVGNQLFGGTITGTNFVTGSTEVWFCPVNSNNCSQHPPAGVTVNNPGNLSVVNVRLSAGSWQLYLKTAAGTSDKSSPFTVQAATASCITTVAADRWRGEYFNNRSLTGNALMVRDDSDVNGGPFFAHVWGTGSPNAGCGVAVDDFSVRWTRRQNFDAGQYQFTLRADDGVRFYIDNVVRLDKWQDQVADFTIAVNLTAGNHDLKVEYYEHGGEALVQIYWERVAGNTSPTIARYEWSPTPTGNQPFGGTIFGGHFVTGNTEVWFCPVNSNNCSQHPPVGVTVNDPGKLSVINVRLSTGSWQVYVKTPSGTSDKSTSFSVK